MMTSTRFPTGLPSPAILASPTVPSWSRRCAESARRTAVGTAPGPPRRLLLALYLLSGWWLSGWWFSGQPVQADDFSTRSVFIQQLSAPMTSVLDGKTFRGGLESLASETGLNLWLDRHVDPTAPIDCGPVGPTVYQALRRLAESRQCEVMPVANVVLIGRTGWVDQTTTAILAMPPSKRGEVIDVDWQELTTPQEALERVLDNTSTQGNTPTLPHDLWPAVHWQKIERQVAVTLIRSQFERGNGSTDSSPATEAVTRRYAKDSIAPAELRQAMRQVDPSCQTRVSDNWIVSKATAPAHRAATDLILTSAVKPTGPDLDRDTFTLKKMTTSAENAFRQLAQAAQRKCVIEPEALEACRTMVAIEGVDLTLRQLMEMVATQADVQLTWQDDSVVVSAKHK